jgi:hypothetical protein
MSGVENLRYKDERWFQLLLQAVKESGVQGTANRLSAGFEKTYSRPTISQIIHGIYLGKPDKIAARVMAVLDKWPCPYMNTDISGEDCRAVYSGETPSHDPARLAHRRMCRTCKHNEGGKS